MRSASIATVLLVGCVGTSFRSTAGATHPPIANRAVIVDGDAAREIMQQAERIGEIEDAADTGELVDRAAEIAALHGGTHLVEVRAAVMATVTSKDARSCTSSDNAADSRNDHLRGGSTATATLPASAGTCNDNSSGDAATIASGDNATWPAAYMATIATPVASLAVYRLARERWAALPPSLRPVPWDPSAHTPARADGSGLSFGAFTATYPGATSGTSGETFSTTYIATPAQARGLWLAWSRDPGPIAYAVDLRIGGGSIAGTAMRASSAVPVAYRQGFGGTALVFRLGKRLAWRNFAWSAGTGLGGAIWISGQATTVGSDGFIEPGNTFVPDLYAPLWTAVTFKPSCDWGVQGLAEYDARPFDFAASSSSFSAGLIWQPASACM